MRGEGQLGGGEIGTLMKVAPDSGPPSGRTEIRKAVKSKKEFMCLLPKN